MRKIIIVMVLGAAVAGVIVALFMVSQTRQDTARTTGNPKTYVALGDSVAAGIGLEPYSDASACDRTDQSYPKLLSVDEKFDLTSYACSGATIAAGISGPQTVNGLTVQPQLDRLFASGSTPDVITLTIGANDIGWTRFTACYTTECDVREQEGQLDASVSQLRSDLLNVLERIKREYTKDEPTVVVTGYYDLVPATVSSSCKDVSGLDANEVSLARYISDKLNSTIKQAVEQSSAALYAKINFSGHELCADDSWIQGISDKAPFHPTAEGQRHIAKQVHDVIELARGD